jgi:hypothetical protein
MSTAAPTSTAPAAASASRRSAGQQPAWLWPVIGLGGALVLVTVGYLLTSSPSDEQLPSAYGRRRGSAELVRSVNGTNVLAEMFKASGHRVTSWTRLSPRLDDYDVIVWAPDDFAPPTKEQRQFLEDWLARGEDGRVVVYIGRDYDAAAAYWSGVLPGAPAEDEVEIRRRLARAKADYASSRAKMPVKEYARWFTVKRDGPYREIRTLAGPWSQGIDASQCEITLQGRLDVPMQADRTASDPPIPDQFDPLLTSQGDILALKVTDPAWGAFNEVIVIANGSWLLNYPLVNHEHRKLAARLVNECGPPGGRVAFIESGAGGPSVLDKEPSSGDEPWPPYPLNVILVQVTIVGIVFCLARFPIFGRPRDLPSEPAADFGKHVAALGELLARSQDRNYAQARLAQYRELAKRDSGKSHLKRK